MAQDLSEGPGKDRPELKHKYHVMWFAGLPGGGLAVGTCTINTQHPIRYSDYTEVLKEVRGVTGKSNADIGSFSLFAPE